MNRFESVADLVASFERFVREEIEEVGTREAFCFDEVAEAVNPGLVLYGFGSLGRMLFKGLEGLGLRPEAIADTRLSSQQTEIEGVPCLSAEQACARFGDDCVFVVAVFNQSGGNEFGQIKLNLNSLGARRVVYFLPFLWKYPGAFLPYYSLNLPSNLLGQEEEILRVFDLLHDDLSKREFASFLYHLVCPDPLVSCPPSAAETYFPDDIFQLSKAEVFLDGGAFNGDTLATFVQRTGGRFSKYIGVEPDPINLQALRQRVASLEGKVSGALETRGSAIGSRLGRLPFAANGLLGSALSSSGNRVVPISRLDRLLEGAVPTYIKLDIEGAELDALAGVKEFLSETKPKLAACVYHRQDHLWKIPALMHEINPRYRLFLRRHREYLDDVVAYAVPA